MVFLRLVVRLREDARETKQRIELIEANADDRSKLMSYEVQRYREILAEYERTWRSYHVSGHTPYFNLSDVPLCVLVSSLFHSFFYTYIRFFLHRRQAEYEDFPLAKKRKEAEIDSKKVRIEKMVLEFKLDELEKKFERRRRIDEIRTRLKIIELAKAMIQNEKLERKLVELRNEIDRCKGQLHSRESEVFGRTKRYQTIRRLF